MQVIDDTPHDVEESDCLGQSAIVHHAYDQMETQVTHNGSFGGGGICTDETGEMSHLFENLYSVRKSHLNNLIIGHLNINSLSPKICEVRALQRLCKLDVLVLSETKLDGSYKQETLHIDGFSCVRQDKRSNSGGLLVYISKDIPYSIGNISICNDEIECISIELHIHDEKILILGMYKKS